MTSNSFDDNALSFGTTTKEFLFEWRAAHQQQKKTLTQRTLMWIAGTLLLASFAFAFWILFTSIADLSNSLRALSWQSLKPRQVFQLTVELPLYLLGFIAFLWIQRRLRGSRLHISHAHMRHTSGLPEGLAQLLKQNWTLSLDDVRSGKIHLTLSGAARAHASLAWFAIQWNADGAPPGWLKKQLTLQRLVPAGWFLIGESAREPIEAPKGLFWRSLNPWATPAGEVLLQKAFNQLPVIAALRAHGVSVPPLATARRNLPGGSIDLMAYPRIKALVLSFFSLLVGAGVMFHLMRHQHFFHAPPPGVWAAIGGLCAVAGWLWLRTEQAPAESSFKQTQVLIAALFGVAAALAAPSALLAVNAALTPPRLVAVTVNQAPLQIMPDDKSIPPFSPSQAKEFWAERGALSGRQITVRKGLFGMWQYDSEPFEEEVWAFYKTYNGYTRLPGK